MLNMYVGVHVGRLMYAAMVNEHGETVRQLKLTDDADGARQLVAAVVDVTKQGDAVYTAVEHERRGGDGLLYALVGNKQLAPLETQWYIVRQDVVNAYIDRVHRSRGAHSVSRAELVARFVRDDHALLPTWLGTRYAVLRRHTRELARLRQQAAREKAHVIALAVAKFNKIGQHMSNGRRNSCPQVDVDNHELVNFLLTHLTVDDILNTAPMNLVKLHPTCHGMTDTTRRRFTEILKVATQASYRLKRNIASGLTLNLSSAFMIYTTLRQQEQVLRQAVNATLAQINDKQLVVLNSIPGMNTVYAGTLLSEIVDINRFHTVKGFVRYCGLGDDGQPRGNAYLRQALIGLTRQMYRHSIVLRKYMDARMTAEEQRVGPRESLLAGARKCARMVYAMLRDERLFGHMYVNNTYKRIPVQTVIDSDDTTTTDDNVLKDQLAHWWSLFNDALVTPLDTDTADLAVQGNG